MSRHNTSPALLELSGRLLAYEAARNPPGESKPPVFLASEKLRRPLSRLAGTAGYRSLMERAVTLAKAKAPVLGALQTLTDGSLVELSPIADQSGSAPTGVELIAELLALLVAFIGENLVMSLVAEIWPELSQADHEILEKNGL